tara:strand:+ start:253 stop:420 length:168 start_codon:yes stop_codon:yes gene_type:complete
LKLSAIKVALKRSASEIGLPSFAAHFSFTPLLLVNIAIRKGVSTSFAVIGWKWIA